MKIGDKVRFLSEVGGGIVKGFQGKDIVLVEDADGFDIPMLCEEFKRAGLEFSTSGLYQTNPDSSGSLMVI